MAYVVAFSGNTAKDVTQRCAVAWEMCCSGSTHSAVLTILHAEAHALGHVTREHCVMAPLICQSGAWMSTPVYRYVKSFRAVEKLRDEQWWQETLQPLRPQLASSAHRGASSLPSGRKAQVLPASKVPAAKLLVLHFAALPQPHFSSAAAQGCSCALH